MNARRAIFFVFLFLNLFFGLKNLLASAYLYAIIDFAIAYSMVYFTYGTVGNCWADLKSTVSASIK
jgi:hypothetical protein